MRFVNDAGSDVNEEAASDAALDPASTSSVEEFPTDEDEDDDGAGAPASSEAAADESLALDPEQPEKMIAASHGATSAIDRISASSTQMEDQRSDCSISSKCRDSGWIGSSPPWIARIDFGRSVGPEVDASGTMLVRRADANWGHIDARNIFLSAKKISREDP
jgi:hypothetical protein